MVFFLRDPLYKGAMEKVDGPVLAVVGSARGDSNTMKALRALSPFETYEVIDLLTLHIEPYRYDRTHEDWDDFPAVAERMAEAGAIVFATPVYWYAMSGTLKNFFDRLTDLLTLHKSVGRALAGKPVYLVAQGTDPELPEGFDVPFRRTAAYFEMPFLGTFYLCMKD